MYGLFFSVVAFIVGFLCGFNIVYDSYNKPGSAYTLAIKAVEECEKGLPRNQHCTITAVLK